MDAWMDGMCLDALVDNSINSVMDGWVGEWMDGWMDGCMDGWHVFRCTGRQ